jgi:hypothetical protein
MSMEIYTLARCNVVLVISALATPLMLPKGSSSFVNKRIRLSAVFADLRWFHPYIRKLCMEDLKKEDENITSA